MCVVDRIDEKVAPLLMAPFHILTVLEWHRRNEEIIELSEKKAGKYSARAGQEVASLTSRTSVAASFNILTVAELHRGENYNIFTK